MYIITRLNTKTVLADYIPNTKCPKSFYQETYKGRAKSCVQCRPAGIMRSDQCDKVSFIYQNPRFVNEPICFTNTTDTCKKQCEWWPDTIPTDKKPITKFSPSTISRIDYGPIIDRPKRASRFGCNKQKLIPAKGFVPGQFAVEESVIAWEKISYEHKSDSRRARTERGRLQGTFIWEPVTNCRMRERIEKRLFDS